jgi:2-methylcitrate dehydratase PrpD
MAETAQLAEFAVGLRLEDCPSEVVLQAKRCILETLGCALAGSRTPLAKAAIQSATRLGDGGPSTAIGLARRIAPDRAALVNGLSANALDYDGGIVRQGHYGPTVVPSTLAMAELTGASGCQFLEAVIAAYEVVTRVGLAIRASAEQSSLVSGYGPHQGFAAVVAAGRMLGLNVDQMVNALGIYGAFAPLPSAQQWNWHNRPLSWTKDMVAWPSVAGINAALLAQAAFLGPRTIFEGDKGFWRMAGSDRYSPETLVAGLGKEFNLLRVYFKTYPSCRWNHAALDGVTEILEQRGWSPADITIIDVGVASELLGYHFDDYSPTNLVDAEFSMPYAVALVLHGEPPSYHWYDPEPLHSARIRETMRKVTLRVDPEMEWLFEEKRISGAIVRITAVDGSVETARVDYARGSAERPIDDIELEAKFRTLAQAAIDEPAAERLLRIVKDLDRAETVSELGKLLAG